MLQRTHWAILIIVVLGLMLVLSYLDSQSGTEPYPGMGGDFTLNSSHGPVSLKDFRGKVVPIYFGYTSCPDICPTSLSALGRALKQLDEHELSQVQSLFISVDPERDSTEKLAEYAKYFHPGMLGITGNLDLLNEIAKRYGAFFHKAEIKGSAMGYAVDHSSIIFVVDKQGVLQQMIQHSNNPQDILEKIREVLAQ
jgi:protein SCO1/2